MSAILTIITKADIHRLAAGDLDGEKKQAVEAVLIDDDKALEVYERIKRRFEAMESRGSQ